MGYYISIESSTFALEPKHYDDAYKAMCALNLFDEIKRGGSHHKDPDTGVVTENKWFSWMSPNYPDTLTTANQIFEEIGFELSVSETGTELSHYDNKAGQEDLFLEACCPWASGNIEWRGEDGAKWMDNYDGVTVKRYHPVDEWVQDKSYIGAMNEASDYVLWLKDYKAEMALLRKVKTDVEV